MKTQIFRSIFIALALMLSINNNANSNGYFYKLLPSKVCTHIFDSTYNNVKCIKNVKASNNMIETITASENSQNLNCYYCIKERPVADIPEPNGDHEFHAFHFKHDGKRFSFLKTILNKTLGLVYLLLVVVAYLPYRIFK